MNTICIHVPGSQSLEEREKALSSLRDTVNAEGTPREGPTEGALSPPSMASGLEEIVSIVASGTAEQLCFVPANQLTSADLATLEDLLRQHDLGLSVGEPDCAECSADG